MSLVFQGVCANFGDQGRGLAHCRRGVSVRVWVNAGPFGSFYVGACREHARPYQADPAYDPPVFAGRTS